MTQPWMSVVVPAYNEEAGIATIVAALHDRLGTYDRSYEIVVVDNASEDGTLSALNPLLEHPRVRVLCNDVNRGKGFSVRRGMLEARGELRLLCDADCAPSLESLPRMLEALETVDVVSGSRVAGGADVDLQQSFRRRLVGWPFIALTRALMGEPTRDVYCGFKLWSADAAEAVFPLQSLDGWVFDAEVLALARRFGFRTAEVGVVWSDRRGSKLAIGEVLIPAVRELLAARANVRSQPRRRRAVEREPTPQGAGPSREAALAPDDG